jgi:hypothetical protein
MGAAALRSIYPFADAPEGEVADDAVPEEEEEEEKEDVDAPHIESLAPVPSSPALSELRTEGGKGIGDAESDRIDDDDLVRAMESLKIACSDPAASRTSPITVSRPRDMPPDVERVATSMALFAAARDAFSAAAVAAAPASSSSSSSSLARQRNGGGGGVIGCGCERDHATVSSIVDCIDFRLGCGAFVLNELAPAAEQRTCMTEFGLEKDGNLSYSHDQHVAWLAALLSARPSLTVVGVETPVESRAVRTKAGSLTLVGRADLVAYDSATGCFEIVDVKTCASRFVSGPRGAFCKEQHRAQLLIYGAIAERWLCERLHPWVACRVRFLQFAVVGSLYEADRVSVHLAELPRCGSRTERDAEAAGAAMA